VIDEKGTMRDVYNWERVRDERAAQIYNEPAMMWQHLGRMPLAARYLK
jgi:hypothetical protein